MKQPGQPLGLGFADTAFAIELSETAHKSLGFAASSRAQLTLVASPLLGETRPGVWYVPVE